MYANSPLKDGKPSGFISYRTKILREMMPDRMGIHKSFLEPHFGFQDWVDFAVKIPMVAIIREGNWIPVKSITFQQFLKEGYMGYAPNMEDWTLHLSYLYTDCRIKKYIEVRVCDSLPPYLIPSLQAIVKAFVYHPDGAKAVAELTKDFDWKDIQNLYLDIAKEGMMAEYKGKKIISYCKEILNIATENLRSFAVMNEKQEDA